MKNLFLALALSTAMLAGCGDKKTSSDAKSGSKTDAKTTAAAETVGSDEDGILVSLDLPGMT